ncbi:hypothetical protein CEE36_11125 [candidate division TA06 bacterium B3_TA06]|uniref:Uncharacterized protein n=1 Tax=candidate division TA06 bacterium B3_TA06 TaxID=2012487 RepID=A0A532UQS2_UNCT6|nr:MAG: hypothetical protein CEE36_11125 [candidate division TA06 bacterium B3_TA06]
MKKQWKMLLILGVMLIALWGCQRELPQAPTLISPEDGAFFTDEPPTFIWGSEDAADSYVLRICKGYFPDDIFLEEAVEDTIYVMPKAVFAIADTGTYIWAVASLPDDGDFYWSEIRYRFLVGAPGEEPVWYLDTTYFPLGEGYEWIYQRHTYIRSHYGDEDDYDIITIRVTESSSEGNHLYFKLEGGSFADVGSQISIVNDSISPYWGYESVRIHVIPQPAHYRQEGNYYYIDLEISYQGDTLWIVNEEFYDMDGYYGYSTQRLKGIGVIHQHKWYWTGGSYEDGHHLQLLYFIKGDTVWRFE